ncbi:MAG: AAC(3) family N-acetyltransferase [Promethearchaeota archaeon]|nr:MAG: AAC(3) family N-acetyltransferase [Candidatus Lokiarchaeota archaeon]
MGTEPNKLSEKEVVRSTQYPKTITTLKRDFKALGIKPGSVILMHSSLSKIGWIVGGSVAIIKALMEILTPKGTLIMPAFTADNTDPRNWENPPVPESWWDIIRNEMPGYDPRITPPRKMGRIVNTFRNWPNVIRSKHPVSSFAAWGKYAKFITKKHELEADLGENSPIARIYELDGYILLVGVTHENNSSLHLAEYRSEYPNKKWQSTGSAILIGNKRQWVEWEELDLNSDDFEQLGADFEAKINYIPSKVGLADARLFSQRDMVDFAVNWIKKNRRANF